MAYDIWHAIRPFSEFAAHMSLFCLRYSGGACCSLLSYERYRSNPSEASPHFSRGAVAFQKYAFFTITALKWDDEGRDAQAALPVDCLLSFSAIP